MAAVIGGLVTFGPPVAAASSRPALLLADPAHYRYTETIVVTNQSATPAVQPDVRVMLLPPPTPYSRVTVRAINPRPARLVKDALGNTVGVFSWRRLAPHGRRVIRIAYQDTSSAIFYRFHKQTPQLSERSPLYLRYTNPRFEAAQGVNTDAPAVRRVVQKVALSLTSPLARARALFVWETAHIRYSSTVHHPGGAVATLRRGKGNCSDFAQLYAALLRTAKIPARLISGYVTNNGGGKAGFHQWDEFYVQGTGWVAADPTWGRFGYFASIPDDWHVALYAGGGPAVHVTYWSRGPDGNLQVRVHYAFLAQDIPTHMLSKKARPLLPVGSNQTARRANLSWRARLQKSLQAWWSGLVRALGRIFARV